MNDGIRLGKRDAVLSVNRLRSLPARWLLRRAAAVGLVLAVCLTAASAETALAKPKQMKVRVYDAQGQRVENADVHVYMGAVPEAGWCLYMDGSCAAFPHGGGTTGKSGQVRIGPLLPDTTYTVAVGDGCVTPTDGCTNFLGCEWQASAKAVVTTNSQGGSTRPVDLRQ